MRGKEKSPVKKVSATRTLEADERRKSLAIKADEAKIAFFATLKESDAKRVQDMLFSFSFHREALESDVIVVASEGISIDEEGLVGCIFLHIVKNKNEPQEASMQENTTYLLTKHCAEVGKIKNASLFSPGALVVGNPDQTPIFMTFAETNKSLKEYARDIIMGTSSDFVVLSSILQVGSAGANPHGTFE